MEPGCVYYFLEKGAIYRREGNGKMEQTVKEKEKDKTWKTTSSRVYNKPKDVIEQPKFSLEEFSSY
jgi:hypothetical protein